MCLLGGLCFTLEFVLLMLARSLACCCSLVVCLREGMGFGSVWSVFGRCLLVCVEVRKEDIW